MNGKNQLRSHRVIYLISGYIGNILTMQEHTELEQWRLENAENEVLFGQLTDNRFQKIELQDWKPDETEQVLRRLQARQMNTSVPIWRKIAVAASVAVIVFGTWFFSAQYMNGDKMGILHPEFISGTQYDIAPGSNKATLTLADGKKIVLSDEKSGVVIGQELKYNDSTFVMRSDREGSGSPEIPEDSKMQMLTASTPRGGTYQVTLPDGTKVWINAASVIKFPLKFNGGDRRVFLEGEAYFEVAHDREKPFKVVSKGQQVQVLGTHFNINCYADESSVKTTLLAGSVNVNGVILKPNQQAIVKAGALNVTPINADDVIAWKRGEFVFKGEDIRSVMKRVAKWYDIEVVYKGAIPSEGFNGIVSRNKNISQVLKMLEETNAVHFRIAGKQVYVSK